VYYTTAIPGLGMLVVLHRSYSFGAVAITLGLFFGLILPNERVFIRNVIGFVRCLLEHLLCVPNQTLQVLFWAFMFYLHYSREMASHASLHHAYRLTSMQIERRMFMLNAQLKIAYRGQQKAQIAESKASHAKRR